MAKFRKITNIIDAIKWTGDIKELENIYWTEEAIQKQIIIFGVNDEKDKDALCLIDRGTDIERVDKGDYIVKEGKEIYMIPEKVFEETYEQVKGSCVIEAKIDTEAIAKYVNEAIQKFKEDLRKKDINA